MRTSRRVLLSGLAAAGLVVGSLIAVLPDASAAINLLANPGFESGNLSGWTCDASDSVSSHAHSGSFALAGAAGNDTAQCAQTVTLVANTAYTLSAYVQGAYTFLGVSGGATGQTWTSNTAYAPLSLNFTTGSSTTVTVYVHGWYGQGTYYADDVVLSGPGGGPSPTASSPSKSPSKSPSTSPSPSKSPSKSPSPSTSPSTSPPPPPPPGDFRNPIYFMPLDNNPQNITDAINASGDRDFNLAFVLDSGGCTPAWDGRSE